MKYVDCSGELRLAREERGGRMRLDAVGCGLRSPALRWVSWRPASAAETLTRGAEEKRSDEERKEKWRLQRKIGE